MTSTDRITVSKTVNTPKGKFVANTASNDLDKTHCKAAVDNNSTKALNLMMISCEENPPYGPSKETALMFLELLCDAYEKKKKKKCFHSCSSFVLTSAMSNEIREQPEQIITNNNDNDDVTLFTIRITIYHARRNDYPLTSSEWRSYDGVIIPGSLSAAYDTQVEWIGKLQSVIRDKIHHMRLKTLGVCFGHQCFAHAFGTNADSGDDVVNGRAIKCPSGSKAGRISSKLTKEGRQLLPNICDDNSTECSMEMLYTHGDMVQCLPEFAISLGGNANVPIEACAYFSSREDKILFEEQQLLNPTTNNNGSDIKNDDGVKKIEPYAVTFQAHPEYVSTTGFNVNYFNTVRAMQARGYISQQLSEEVCEDAKVNFDRVQEDSLNATIAVATALDWF